MKFLLTTAIAVKLTCLFEGGIEVLWYCINFLFAIGIVWVMAFDQIYYLRIENVENFSKNLQM